LLAWLLFGWFFLQILRRWGCYPTCHFHAWHIIEALGGKVITDDGSIPFFTSYELVTQIVIRNKFCTMEWNGMDQMMEFSVAYPNWGWNEKSGWKQYTGNKTGEQSSFLTNISPQMSFTPSFGFCMIWLSAARPSFIISKACQHKILQIFWTDTQFLEMDLLILWRHSNWGWNRD
jgi:hypothetical protein